MNERKGSISITEWKKSTSKRKDFVLKLKKHFFFVIYWASSCCVCRYKMDWQLYPDKQIRNHWFETMMLTLDLPETEVTFIRNKQEWLPLKGAFPMGTKTLHPSSTGIRWVQCKTQIKQNRERKSKSRMRDWVMQMSELR